MAALNITFRGLRVVDVLEKRYSQFAGLNLSWEVRESIAKHNLLSDDPNVKQFDMSRQPLLEAKIVDIADSIAYDNHDIDDSLKARLITESGLEEVELWRYAKEKVKEQYSNLSKDMENTHTIKYLIDMEVTDLIEHTQLMIEKMKIKTTDDVQESKENLVSFSPEISKRNWNCRNSCKKTHIVITGLCEWLTRQSGLSKSCLKHLLKTLCSFHLNIKNG